MYNEDMAGKYRTGWAYSYKGKELLPFALNKYSEYKTKENSAREKMAIMIKDPVSYHDVYCVRARRGKVPAFRPRAGVSGCRCDNFRCRLAVSGMGNGRKQVF